MLFADFTVSENFWVSLAGSAAFGLIGLVQFLPVLLDAERQFAEAEVGVAGGDEQRDRRIRRAFEVALRVEERHLGGEVGADRDRIAGGQDRAVRRAGA